MRTGEDRTSVAGVEVVCRYLSFFMCGWVDLASERLWFGVLICGSFGYGEI